MAGSGSDQVGGIGIARLVAVEVGEGVLGDDRRLEGRIEDAAGSGVVALVDDTVRLVLEAAQGLVIGRSAGRLGEGRRDASGDYTSGAGLSDDQVAAVS